MINFESFHSLFVHKGEELCYPTYASLFVRLKLKKYIENNIPISNIYVNLSTFMNGISVA